MGEYYHWVNINKEECLHPGSFGLSSHITGSIVKDCDFLRILYSLLDNKWKNDLIVWLGDEGEQLKKDDTNNALKLFYDKTIKYGYEADYLVALDFKDISDCFKIEDAETLKEVESFKYVINHTKKCCYDPITVRVFNFDEEEMDYADPLPLLMNYGRDYNQGAWLGDIIGVSNDIPDGYNLISEVHIY